MRIWETFTNRRQWEEYLKTLVKTNDRALFKAIVLIYDMQTQEEKASGESVEENKVGFSKVDAKEMGIIASKIKNGKPLTTGEIAKSRNKMQKYWKQLMIISKGQMKEREQEELNQVEMQMALEKSIETECFVQHNEILRACAEEGISCDYGICDECVLTTGFQMGLKL